MQGGTASTSSDPDKTVLPAVPLGRKAPYTYTVGDDITLLKEVLLVKPFGKHSFEKWTQIHSRCKIPVKDGVALQRRLNFLVQNRTSLLGSGVDEDYTEKDKLLQDIKDLKEVYKTQQLQIQTKKETKEEIDMNQAQRIREAAVESMKRSSMEAHISKDSRCSSKVSKKDDVLVYLQRMDDMDTKVKETNFDLEKRRLVLQERELSLREMNKAHAREMDKEKLQLEHKKLEREGQRVALEVEEKKLFMDLLKTMIDKSK